MDFGLTWAEHKSAIRDASAASATASATITGCDHDNSGAFPVEFHRAMAEGGWLGIAMPEEFGGAALGVTEAAIMMHDDRRLSGAMAAASSVHINIFGPHPIVVHGTPEQKQRWLPPLIAGTTRPVSASPSPMPGSTPAASRRRPKRRRAATSCTARRSGPPPRSRPTRSCWWRAPRRASSAGARSTGSPCSTPISTAARSRCA